MILGSEDDLLIPSNIPVVNFNELSEEQQLMMFVSPYDLYIDGLKLIVRCDQ